MSKRAADKPAATAGRRWRKGAANARDLMTMCIKPVVARDAEGNFAPVDISLEGVNKWRASMGLEPLKTLPSKS